MPQKKRYLTIVKTELEGFWLTDEKGRLLEVNDAYCRMSGYTEAELLTMHITDLEAVETPEDFAEHQQQILHKGEARFETRHRRKDGSLFDVEVTARSLKDENGLFVAFLRDITARQQAEESLRQSEAFTKTILDNLPVGIAVNQSEPPVRFEYMNDNFPKIYRTTKERLADPDSFWEAVYEDPGFREEIKKKVLDDCASDDPQRMYWEEIPITREGEPTTYITACNIPVPEKKLMISMVWDVTETKTAQKTEKKLQQQLRQVQKLESVGRLAGGIAHDFNNMLGVILGHVELLMEHFDQKDPALEDLRQIRFAARRSTELTKQLLAFARRQTVDPKILDLNMDVDVLLKMLRRLIGEDIDLVWVPGRELWPVKLDPAQLDQLLANLCVNARDAIADVGKITIETTNTTLDQAYCDDHTGFLPGNYVQLTISDNGCGIERKYIDSIFEPFFTTKEMGKGTGLGLATVYGIVKQNNGFINVYSEPGCGTTFRIYLPRYRGDGEPVQVEKPAEPVMQGEETILLVEDEPVLLELGKRMLEKQGYTVLATTSPREAIRIAGEYPEKIHLLMTDLVMPEMNGRDLAEKLHEILPDLQSLYMSGYTADVIAHHGVLDKGVNFIQKPFSSRDLAIKIREILDADSSSPEP